MQQQHRRTASAVANEDRQLTAFSHRLCEAGKHSSESATSSITREARRISMSVADPELVTLRATIPALPERSGDG